MQGIGQALYENCVYDKSTGQLLTGSFVDCAIPHAAQVPPLSFAYNEVPCTANPLGVKGSGEAGAIGAPPATMNAIVDALAEFGVTLIEMPATRRRFGVPCVQCTKRPDKSTPGRLDTA